MRDANVTQYLDGLGCQWDSNDTMAETHLLFPNMKLMQTEAECGNHENNWTFAEYQYGLAQKWFGAGAGSNIVWNLVLDETGLSTGGWAQCSPVVVNSQTGAVTYTPYFYLYKHFSWFVQPGAHIASTYGSWGDKIAFTNPDGSVVIVMANRSGSDLAVTLNIDGERTAPVTLPAHSFNTFTLAAPETPLSALEQWRLQYFGTTANSGDAADAADPDGDGMANSQEYVSGTIPTDGSSYLRITQLEPGAMGVQITFTTVSGKTYRVEYTDSLQPASWTLLQGNIQGTGGVVQVTDPGAASHSQRFYRIVVSA